MKSLNKNEPSVSETMPTSGPGGVVYLGSTPLCFTVLLSAAHLLGHSPPPDIKHVALG